ncbi:hypothetical protein HME9302_01378 [Alteripontixanthobacter maritimus]|uniref:CBU-0592-like domain-containing protein n=1 Tax=Alteripontixanthobacter maritimus TaxID=2161824 RepID=A0A369QD17_9SPHN|nr:permease [Alteripontixanthobacter maritimus]RDC60178.1 hypothetical protein HME9302_01378 [Alteripontixanthobacter maritimus]
MMPPLDIYTLVGFVGMACIIAAYAYVTVKNKPDPFILHGTNLAGAVLLTVSLVVHTNLPSLVLEGFWAAIAIYGLAKAFRGRAAHDRSDAKDIS